MNESICYVDMFGWTGGWGICFFNFQLPNSIHSDFHIQNMVGVAQLVEPQVVALVVVGSSPITHPIINIGN